MKTKFSKIFLMIFISFVFLNTNKIVMANTVECGEPIYTSDQNDYTCNCDSGEWVTFTNGNNEYSCCGWVYEAQGKNRCFNSSEPEEVGSPIIITEGLTNETFDSLNPLIIADSSAADELSTPGGIVSRLLNFLFPLAGLALFFLISWGGFEILIGATDQKGMEAGKNRITAAIVGFIFLFSSYWLTQIVEVIFGISIL